MGIIKTITKTIIKTVTAVILIAMLAISATSASLIYDFRKPKPFEGPDIFNPYRNLDTAYCWKRANFHTHTRVDGLMNECEKWPGEVYADLEKFGYEIITFSNHNRLTAHPFNPALQVNVYEHGYNLFKFHKLVFGSDKVMRFDHLIPVFPSQRQFQLDLLNRNADIVQINHPLRTNATSQEMLEKLSGYQLIELDSGRSTENTYWDWALSSGHYCFAVANDDLHYPDRTHCIAVRCNFLCCPSAHYEDIKRTLLDGCYYSMRVPDYGRGDWEVKYEENRHLPYIKEIGLDDDTIYMSLSEPADSIKVNGQGHSILYKTTGSESIRYHMDANDTYARLTAYFPKGEVIYTNAFARYDSAQSESPMCNAPQKVNFLLTMLYNIAVILLCYGIVLLLRKIIRK